MSAEVKLYDIDGDGSLEILATVFDTSVLKDSSSGSVFVWKYSPDMSCTENSDCDEGYECVDDVCEEIDNDPVLGDGPFVTAGSWPVLSTASASPTYLKRNVGLVWIYSDESAACDEDCTHTAEYRVVGAESWTALDVSEETFGAGYPSVTLPVAQLENATTYEFRYSVTDCAEQTVSSGTYYVRVARTDAPPVIGDGPFVMAGTWPVLSTTAASAHVLKRNRDVLWTFSDDYASCGGPCTHRALYRTVGATAWEFLTVSTDPTGEEYAYTTLPVESLEPGTYQFLFDVRDCAGQYRFLTQYYYFKVE